MIINCEEMTDHSVNVLKERIQMCQSKCLLFKYKKNPHVVLYWYSFHNFNIGI